MPVDGAHGLLGKISLCGCRAAHAGLEWCKTGGPGLRPFMRKYLAGERERGWALAWKEKVDEAAGYYRTSISQNNDGRVPDLVRFFFLVR